MGHSITTKSAKPLFHSRSDGSSVIGSHRPLEERWMRKGRKSRRFSRAVAARNGQTHGDSRLFI